MVAKRRVGFTLIEMTIVIGVLLLLMALSVFGYRMLERTAGNKTTETRLAMCASIFAEYQLASPAGVEGTQINPPVPNASKELPVDTALYPTGVNAIMMAPPNGLRTSTPLTTYGWGPYPAYNVVNKGEGRDSGSLYWPYCPGPVSEGTQNRYSTPFLPYQNRAVLNSSAILQLCAQIPAAQSILASLPPAAMLPVDPSTKTYTDASGNYLPTLSLPHSQGGPFGGQGCLVIVDAWKDPVIYVPSSGIVVQLGATNNGNYTTNVVAGQNFLVQSVDGRGFWASAGQDGDFYKGDDNLYSAAVTLTPYNNP